jgi:hypothetical protein
MNRCPKEMSRTDSSIYDAVVEALKANDCIMAYTIQGQSVSVEWSDGGFDRAFHEFASNPQPFGLKKIDQRAVFMILLREKNPVRVQDFIRRGFKKQYGLDFGEK